MEKDVLQKIQELEHVALLSKHEQLVDGIINAINEQILVQGAMLPSVNSMVRDLGFARKTIVKAYEELKERGIVESKKRLGYFIANESTDLTMRVAVLLYAFHPFQELFYNTFREELGEQFQLDIFFHHNNIEVYENILNSITGRYGMYVVAPIHHYKTKQLLNNFPSNRLLLVDRFEPIGSEYSFIAQEFEKSTYNVLVELKEDILKFDEFVLFYKEDADYPDGSLKAFQRFVKDHNIKNNILYKYKKGTVRKGVVYMTFGDIDLWALLKDCNSKKIQPGEDIGILSTNDSPVKEFISGGITTFCVDFEKMAKKAANYIKNREVIQEIIPAQLQRRNSL